MCRIIAHKTHWPSPRDHHRFGRGRAYSCKMLQWNRSSGKQCPISSGEHGKKLILLHLPVTFTVDLFLTVWRGLCVRIPRLCSICAYWCICIRVCSFQMSWNSHCSHPQLFPVLFPLLKTSFQLFLLSPTAIKPLLLKIKL